MTKHASILAQLLQFLRTQTAASNSCNSFYKFDRFRLSYAVYYPTYSSFFYSFPGNSKEKVNYVDVIIIGKLYVV